MGFRLMKTIDKITWFVYFENITDTKQQHYQSLIEGPQNNPRFIDIWAATDSSVLNTEILIKRQLIVRPIVKPLKWIVSVSIFLKHQ